MGDLDDVRARFRAERCRHVALVELIDADRAAELRAAAEAAGFAAYDEPDRGRGAVNAELVAPELFEELAGLVADIVERPLRVGPARWLRLAHRDYALTKLARDVAGTYVEVTCDFSARATGQAELVYTDGVQSWPIALDPGSVAIVEREPWLYRYERYIDHQIADAVIHRLRLALL